jgi:hypothetical protein
VRIRHIETAEHVEGMAGFDPSNYRIEVAIEDESRLVHFGHIAHGDWRVGDVRLD